MSQAANKSSKATAEGASSATAVDGTYYSIGAGEAKLFVPRSMCAREMVSEAQHIAIITKEAAFSCMGDGGGGEFGAAMAEVVVRNLASISALLESAQHRLFTEASAEG